MDEQKRDLTSFTTAISKRHVTEETDMKGLKSTH